MSSPTKLASASSAGVFDVFSRFPFVNLFLNNVHHTQNPPPPKKGEAGDYPALFLHLTFRIQHNVLTHRITLI